MTGKPAVQIARAEQGKFKKGQSANPAGKPRGLQDRRTAELETLLHGSAKEIVARLVEGALNGDATCLKLATERLYPLRKGRPLKFDMPPLDGAADLSLALGGVLSAISAGELTAEEGVSLAQIIDARRRSIETMELEKRVIDLERLLKE